MGQKPSHISLKTEKVKLPLSWIITRSSRTTRNPNPEQPIKFQYKTRRKSTENPKENDKPLECSTPKSSNAQLGFEKPFKAVLPTNQFNNVNDVKCKVIKTPGVPVRTKSEPNIAVERKEKHRHRRKSTRSKVERRESIVQQFGYEIQDIDSFLNKATLEKPANIPVVLAFPSVLYQTREGGYQAEISLPLGMVVNAIFKIQNWLYVQTPHAEEGYVSYTACLPLGIIPPPDDEPAPCWEKSTDIFPKPSGNMTDTEKISSKSDCSLGRCHSRRSRNAASTCDEKSVDKLYLRATTNSKSKGVTRHTLLVISSDYSGKGNNALQVYKGDVVALLSAHLYGWFWVKNNKGEKGYIPSAIAGHGFL